MNELPDLPLYLFEPNASGLLSTILTFVLPLIAAVVMRQSWGTGIKGVTLLLVSSVKVFIEALIAHINSGVSFNPWVLLYGAVLNFLVAVAVYVGLLRGTTLQQAAINSGNKDRTSVEPEAL